MNNYFDRSAIKERAKAALKKCYWLAFGVAAIVSMILGELSAGNVNVDLSGLTSSEADGFKSQMPFIEQSPFSESTELLPLLLVFLLFFFLMVYVLIVGAVFVKAYFLDGVIHVGGAKFFLGVTHGQAQFKDVFAGFGKNYRNISKVLFARFWRLLLWEMFALIPVAAAVAGVIILRQGGLIFGTVHVLLAIFGMIPAMIPYLIKSYEYSMIPYLLAEYPEMTVKEAFAATKELTEGHKGELFVLDLSFFGWQLLGVLTLGVGLVFLEPYMKAAWAESYAELCRLKYPPAPTPFAPIVPPAPVESNAEKSVEPPQTEE